ncbi:MAG: EthD domain-containing protein [Nitrospirota bacterium]
MIRLITCIKRKKDISPEKFRNHWNDPEFEILLDKLVSLLEPLRLSRKLTLQVGANVKIMQMRGSLQPYDAIIEWWFENAARLGPRLATPEARAALRETVKYQSQFVDFEQSPSFFTEG